MFENVASATAPAQVVEITDQLDASSLRLSSLSLGPVHFGDVFTGPPPGLKHWTTDIDLRPEQDLIVRVDGDLNATTGLLRWRFSSLDPETLRPTTDPEAGFLPPNDDPPEGEGAVYFSVSPEPALTSGAEIENSSSIVFDSNPAILTNTWLNTIDKDAPTSLVSSATQTGGSGSCAAGLEVAWSGSDLGSGIAGYDIYASIDSAPFALWRTSRPTTADTYPAEAGHSYRFFSVAHDRAGHARGSAAGDGRRHRRGQLQPAPPTRPTRPTTRRRAATGTRPRPRSRRRRRSGPTRSGRGSSSRLTSQSPASFASSTARSTSRAAHRASTGSARASTSSALARSTSPATPTRARRR